MSEEAARKQVAAIQVNQGAFKQPQRAVEDNNHPKVATTMTELFTRLKAITAVGNAFNAESEHIVKQEWVLAFALEGIKSQVVIDRGVEAMRAKSRKSRGTTWFPSIGEFVDACLGSDDKLQFAQRAHNLFINRQRQVDNVGREMLIKHRFELRSMKAAEGKKRFIELYLEFASDIEIEPLKAFALTDGVQLSNEQQKDADNRTVAAQNKCLGDLHGMFGKPEPKKQCEPAKTGVVTGRIKTATKSPAQLEKEKERQLAAIQNKLNGK